MWSGATRHIRYSFGRYFLGNPEKARPKLLAANPHCAATFIPIRPIDSFIRAAAQQNKRCDQSRETLCAHLRLASLSTSENKPLPLRSGFLIPLPEQCLLWAENGQSGISHNASKHRFPRRSPKLGHSSLWPEPVVLL